jgi:hypothetical protein
LLGEETLEAHLLDLVELGFEPVDVGFLVFENGFQEFAEIVLDTAFAL